MAEEGIVVADNSTKQEIIRDDQGKFVAGVSGNPGGRPKSTGMLVSTMVDALKKDDRLIESIVNRLLNMAADGDISAIKEVFDRIEGKPNVSATVTHKVPPRPILDDGIPQDDSN